MEDLRYVIKRLFIYAVTTILLWPSFLFAYGVGTHAALTDETVDFFNSHFSALKLDDGAKALMKQGSMEEDDGARFMHHFYDPVYERGLFGFSSSKEWAEATIEQGGLAAVGAGGIKELFSTEDDFSWERAIYEYAWRDKNRGLETLGHILHLIQDASVPDHTRNDPHPSILDWGSPYEHWTEKFENGFELVGIGNSKPTLLNSLEDYFGNLAAYSNGNFFSEDTIFSPNYTSPTVDFFKKEILSDGQVYRFAYRDSKDSKYKLALMPINEEWRTSIGDERPQLKDNDNLILSDYWSRLSKQAVLHGAGVIKLFFDKVEKEKQTKALYLKNRTWFQKIFDASRDSIFNITAALYGSSVTPEDLGNSNDLETRFPSSQSPDDRQGLTSGTDEVKPLNSNSEVRPLSNLEVEPLIYSGDAVAGTIVMDSSYDPNSLTASTPNPPLRDSFGLIAIPAGSAGAGGEAPRQKFTEQNLGGQAGTADTSITTATDEIAAPLTLESATSTEEAATSTPPLNVPPDFTFEILECAASFSSSGCLIATTTVTLVASSDAPDFARFEIACETAGTACSGFPQIIATSSAAVVVPVSDRVLYTFTVQAVDAVGNGLAISKTVEVSARPVVINEIAWMGTATSSADEWIELYNPTGIDIPLDHWFIRAADGVPFIELDGIIPAKGFYLIERTDDDTVSDITANLIAPFSGNGNGSGLENGGEKLFLEYFDGAATTTMDEVGTLGPRGRWCAGLESPWFWTMERYDANASGNDCANWGRNNTLIKNGNDAGGAQINGTPKARNSISYEIANGSMLTADKTLTKENSPYLVADTITVAAGVTLTIEPGVVIKMTNPSGAPTLGVLGTLRAIGSASEPIIFTGLADDEYGGDMNGDGICDPSNASSTAACPDIGSWKQIYFSPTSVNSALENVVIRYGGRWYSNMLRRAAVIVDGAAVLFRNVAVEYSMKHGVHLINGAPVDIAGSTFRNNREGGDSYGVLIENGNGIIFGSAFANNSNGLRVIGGSLMLEGGSVMGSVNVGLSVINATTTISNVSFSENRLDIEAIGKYSIVCGAGCSASTTSPNPL
ncbi:MAG: hypothetical protein HYT22_01930 [Candidatus Niyogibacteria bacterium]|nr:hypothetical protein [Candidatus Niyogibacteria bacterium]